MPGVCPRCNREVYFAEEKLALGKVWHTFCFSCRNCRKLLNSCNVVTHLGELYCKNCYVRLSLSSTNHEIKRVPRSSGTLAVSAEDLLKCYCCEADIGNAPLKCQRYEAAKCRLRGGGSEAEETNVYPDEKGKHFLENECGNLGTVNSMTTICDPPPSPTAVTTWYNRQHSKFRSTLSLESQKNNTVAKDCRFEGQKQEIDRSEPKTSFSNNEVNITEAQLSTDKTQVPSITWNNKLNESDPVYEFSLNIPSRRKFAYPPVPPPRNPLPSRRRVSFHDVVFGDTRGNDQNCRPCYDNDCRNNDTYDIWQADDSVGKNDGGYENVNVNYTEDSGRMHFEKSASDYGEDDTLSKCNDIEKRRGQDNCIEGNAETRAYRIMNEKDDASSKEDAYGHQSGPNSSNELDDNERMRGGCGGSCGRPRFPCGTVRMIEACACKRDPCADPCRTVTASCTSCSSPCIDRHSCCPPAGERPICKKPIIRCRQPCSEPMGCGGGGCCGSGCRGGCGKPGQTCLPRPCSVPPCRPCSPCSPCSPPRPCSPQVICCCSRKCSNCCGSSSGSGCCCQQSRPKSPCRGRSRRCCSIERSEDSGCCRPRTACECFGGGLDCQRCGRKVYQAEMQIVSGMPFHNICFSCYCCRKPLESLTYQENCGEIYCKQCYVRNFGPQGYGYGVGPGALQTPM